MNKKILETYIDLDRQIKELEKQKESIKEDVKKMVSEMPDKTYNNGDHQIKISFGEVCEYTFDVVFKLFDGNMLPKIMKPQTGQVNKFAELLSDERREELEASAERKEFARILVK